MRRAVGGARGGGRVYDARVVTYTALLFDLDHTLLDSDASEALAFAHALGDVGVDEPARYLPAYLAINRALWVQVERGEITPGFLRVERFARLVAATGIEASAEGLADAFVYGLGEFGELYAGVPAMLDALAAVPGVSLAIVTNGLSEVVRARVRRLALARYFPIIAVSSELGTAKPAPAIFEHALAGLGAAKHAALIIGDSLSSDMQGGRNAGIATCWYNPRRQGASALVDHDIAGHDALLALVHRAAE